MLRDLFWLACLAILLYLASRRIRSRAYFLMNPRYRPFLEHLGLASPHSLLRLPAVIVSGHPDRNVSRVTLGSGAYALSAFLKREHRVRWKQRFANLWAGFGLTSLSHREAITLLQARRAGICCPNWIAIGADDAGRAFLLVEEVPDCVDLRRFLAEPNLSPAQRFGLARELGVTVARLHNAGFAHGDLYAKHFLIDPCTLHISILDWQRCTRPHRVTWNEASHDLASLDATLADDLATPRERLACLRAYFNTRLAATRSLRSEARADLLRQTCTTIRNHGRLLLRRRRIREAAHAPIVKQELIWLDGDALCVTPEFYRECNGYHPATGSLPRNQMVCAPTVVPPGKQALLLRRRTDNVLGGLTTWFGRPPSAPEVRQAALLFRLQRYGIRTSRLLAFGQQKVSPWRTDSFILLEPPAHAQELSDWLVHNADNRCHASARRQLMRDFGTLVQRLHAAGCCLHDQAEHCFSVHEVDDEDNLTVTLTRVDGLRLHPKPNQNSALRDLTDLRCRPETRRISATDKLRFLLAYLGQRRSTPDVKQLLKRMADSGKLMADGYSFQKDEQTRVPTNGAINDGRS